MNTFTAPKQCWVIVFDTDVLANMIRLEQNETITSGLSKLEVYYYEQQAIDRVKELNPNWKPETVPSESGFILKPPEIMPSIDKLDPPVFNTEIDPPVPDPNVNV